MIVLIGGLLAYKVFFSSSFSINGAPEKTMDQMNEPPPNVLNPIPNTAWNTLPEKEKVVKVMNALIKNILHHTGGGSDSGGGNGRSTSGEGNGRGRENGSGGGNGGKGNSGVGEDGGGGGDNYGGGDGEVDGVESGICSYSRRRAGYSKDL